MTSDTTHDVTGPVAAPTHLLAVRAGHDAGDILADLLGGGDRAQRGRTQLVVGMFSHHQGALKPAQHARLRGRRGGGEGSQMDISQEILPSFGYVCTAQLRKDGSCS